MIDSLKNQHKKYMQDEYMREYAQILLEQIETLITVRIKLEEVIEDRHGNIS